LQLQLINGAAGHKLAEEKRDQRDPDERGDHQEEPSDDVIAERVRSRCSQGVCMLFR
jgi:hypothetical protein